MPYGFKKCFQNLGEDRGIAISDSMRGAGLGEGEFELGGQAVFVNQTVNMRYLKTER